MLSPFRHLRGASAVLATAASLVLSPARGGGMPRIHVVGTEFRTEAGDPVWLNGINTAWMHWNDFGGDRFDAVLWDAEFRRYAEAGINCARVWLDCDGEVAVAFDRAGFIVGPAPTFLADVEALLGIAERHGVYVLAVLMSFDHVKPSHARHSLWRRVFNEDVHREAYIRHFVEPLARRFAGDPALLAWEICNEPEWIWFRRYGVSRARVVAFHAHVAAALHAAGAGAVTTGSASWRWHGEHWRGGVRGDQPWSDASLGAHGAGPGARLDFFQVHYYDWMAPLGWSPYASEAGPGRFLRRVDRPVIIGETKGRRSWLTGRSVADSYERGAANGYKGVFGWSAHGRDGHGNFEEIAMATRTMAKQLARNPVEPAGTAVAMRIAASRAAQTAAIASADDATLAAEPAEVYDRVALAPIDDHVGPDALAAGEHHGSASTDDAIY